MSVARLPALTTLVLALLLGAAPWRVCAHGEHGRIWLPGTHEHAAPDGHAHGHGSHLARSEDAPPAHVHGARACRQGHGRSHGAHSHHAHAGCGHRCTPARTRGTPPAPAPHLPTDAPEGPACHCDDAPVVAQPLSLPVEVEAPQLLGWAHVTVPTTAWTGATEVAPSSSEGWRVPCESDSVVLVR